MKFWYVIKREYGENVRKKSFIISTLLAPILLIGIYSIPILAFVLTPGEQISIAVLDRHGGLGDDFIATLTDTLDDGQLKYVARNETPVDGDMDAGRERLSAAINNDALDVLIEIPADVLETGTVHYISKDQFSEATTDRMRARLSPLVIGKRFASEGMEYERVNELTRRVNLEEMKVTKSGVMQEEEVYFEFALVIVFIMILYMSLLSWGVSVQRSVIEEKSSRVVEVLLSSLEPKDLFIGKLLGIGALGLTQIVIWALVMFALGSVGSAIAIAQFMSNVHVEAIDLVFFCVFFVLGFLFYSALFAVIGSICSTEQDAQNLQPLVIIPLVIPMMSMWFVIQNPNATISVVLSMIPFFSPMLMLGRVVLTDINWWELGLCIAILLVSIYIVIVFASKLFRVGILMYGKRPGLREIVRWMKYS